MRKVTTDGKTDTAVAEVTAPRGLKCCFECAGLTVAAYLGTLAVCAVEHRKDDPDKKDDAITVCADTYGGLAQLAVLATCVKANPACHPHGSISNYAGFSAFPAAHAAVPSHVNQTAVELGRFAHVFNASAALPAPFINFEKPKHKRMALEHSPVASAVHKATLALVPHHSGEVDEAFQLVATATNEKAAKAAAMGAGRLAHRHAKQISAELGDAGMTCIVECGAIAAGFFFAAHAACAKAFPAAADTDCVNWTYLLTAGPALEGCLAALPVCRKHAENTTSTSAMIIDAGGELLSWASKHIQGARDAIKTKLLL